MADLISVIVTTYDRVDALDAVLRSLSAQDDRNFEVVVADDGSGPATRALIETWIPRFSTLSHVWHPHEDFRAGEIRNRAILASQGRYVIFLDGDCAVRRDFITRHRALAEGGWFVTGNRALLSDALTVRALATQMPIEQWGLSRWLGQRLRGGINRIASLLHLPLGPLRKLRAKQWEGARSCNLAVWRDDLDRVDGFDAAFAGWGKEDSDLLVRLLNSGVRRKDGFFATGVLHLAHAPADRSRLHGNEQRLQGVIAKHAVRAERGLSSLQRPQDEPVIGTHTLPRPEPVNLHAGHL